MEWSKLSSKKNSFIIRDVILSDTILAAFGHAKGGVYKKGIEKPSQREPLQEKVKDYLIEIEEKYDPTNDHYERIGELKNKIENCKVCGPLLREGQISFGVTQKLVNMYLKYLWCLGKFDMPPHCPIDRGILKEVGWELPLPPFTDSKFTKERYEEAVKRCGIKAKAKGQSLSEWELFIWKDKSVEKPGRRKSEKDL